MNYGMQIWKTIESEMSKTYQANLPAIRKAAEASRQELKDRKLKQEWQEIEKRMIAKRMG